MNDNFQIGSGKGRRRALPRGRGRSPIRDFLRFVGPLVLVTGIGFVIVGFGNFFMSFGSFGFPRYFWCAFVGMPLIPLGAAICWLAYLGPMARYLAEETAPVNKDVINYLARGTEPAVRSVVSAIKAGLSGPAVEPSDKACPRCGERNRGLCALRGPE
jgi:hypothetical protein